MEHTVHIVYQCQIAQDTWTRIEQIMNEARGTNNNNPIRITRDNIMFNHRPANCSDEEARDCLDTIMLVKHIVY